MDAMKRTALITAAALTALMVMLLTAGAVYADEQMTWSDLRTALEAGGEVTMTNDITRNEENVIEISSDAVLDLNGFTLDGDGDNYKRVSIFFVYGSGGKLTIRDSSTEEKGAVQNVWGTSIIGIYGDLVLESGAVRGCVNIGSAGSFTMTGGTIEDNEGYITVDISDGRFTMTGGMITGSSYGVFFGSGSSFTMTGGTITGCKTGVKVDNGGIMAVGGDVKITENDINVYLNSCLLHFASPLSFDASIGIQIHRELQSTEMYCFTDGYNAMARPENFFSDSGYYVDSLGGDELVLSTMTPWGKWKNNSGVINYVAKDGTTSAKVKKGQLTWIKEESGENSAWYGIGDPEEVLEEGSVFRVRWLSPGSDAESYQEYYDKLDAEHQQAVDNGRIRIFLTGAADSYGSECEWPGEETYGLIQLPEEWDCSDISVISIEDDQDEVQETEVFDEYELPDGTRTSVVKTGLRRPMAYAMYDRAEPSSDDPPLPFIRAENTLKIKARTVAVRYSRLKKGSQKLKASKVIQFVSKGQGPKSYKIVSAKKGGKSYKKYFKIAGSTGKLTVKKGLKKGTYKVTIKVQAAGNSKYEASSWKKVTSRIRVK